MLDFQKNMAEFSNMDVTVVAACSDSREDAMKTVEKYNITFKVGYGLNAEETSALTGAFYDREGGYLHATGFVLAPDGRIANAVYSTGPIGRLVAADVLALIKYLREKK